MAIFSPSASPAITVREIDLTGVVPNAQSTTGAIVGDFRWGPVRQATLVDTEASLASTFGTPSATNAVSHFSAAQFLRYSSSLYVVREATSAAKNASATGTVTQIRNKNHWDEIVSSLGDDSGDTAVGLFVARYPGALGNSLRVRVLSPNTAFASPFTTEFDTAPGTSAYATARSGLNDEIHVLVDDEDGSITGTPGTVLERFAYVSVAADAKNTDGSSNYVTDVINGSSNWIFMNTDESVAGTATLTNFGLNASGTTFNASATSVVSNSLTGGVDSGTLTAAEYHSTAGNGYNLFADVDTITVDFIIAPSLSVAADHYGVVNDLVSKANTRKDCVVVASPNIAAVVNSATPVASAVTTAGNYTTSSYLFADNNFLKVYDKYNDQYIHIPAASTTAGVMAATDAEAAPWFSPAGQRRGQYFGITSLAYSPTKSERDTLYKAGINPIANIPGQGILLFGDKTFLNRPSAFDRINVRRLFLVVERAIAAAARNVMFEFNDEFTRAEFVNVVEPFLREIQGRRGITDFRVVCDETNNTSAVIDRNEFIASIFIKPARSINYVTLNFVAVRTGVEFEEVAGLV